MRSTSSASGRPFSVCSRWRRQTNQHLLPEQDAQARTGDACSGLAFKLPRIIAAKVQLVPVLNTGSQKQGAAPPPGHRSPFLRRRTRRQSGAQRLDLAPCVGEPLPPVAHRNRRLHQMLLRDLADCSSPPASGGMARPLSASPRRSEPESSVRADLCSFVALNWDRLLIVTTQSESRMATSLPMCDRSRNLA